MRRPKEMMNTDVVSSIFRRMKAMGVPLDSAYDPDGSLAKTTKRVKLGIGHATGVNVQHEHGTGHIGVQFWDGGIRLESLLMDIETAKLLKAGLNSIEILEEKKNDGVPE